MHVITNAATMVGEEISRVLSRIGLERMCDTGVVPSGIPNAILFNNVAFVKAAPVQSVHPAMNAVKGLDFDLVSSGSSGSGIGGSMSSVGIGGGGSSGSGGIGGGMQRMGPNSFANSSSGGINLHSVPRAGVPPFRPSVTGTF